MPRIEGIIPDHVLRLMPEEERRRLGKAGRTAEEIAVAQATKSERDLHDQISNYLRMKGVKVAVHSRMDKRPTIKTGIPDFLFAWRCRPVALEVKLPGEEPSPEQIGIMAGMEMDGWVVAVVHNLEEVIATLKRVITL